MGTGSLCCQLSLTPTLPVQHNLHAEHLGDPDPGAVSHASRRHLAPTPLPAVLQQHKRPTGPRGACGAGGAGPSQQGSLQTPLKEDEKTAALRRHSALSPWHVSPLSDRRRENTRYSITVLKSHHNKSAKIHFAPCLCFDFREAHLSALRWQQLPQNLISQRCQVLN